MKTIVDIPAALLRQAKRLAARERTTFKAIVKPGLHLKLRRDRAKRKGLQSEWRSAFLGR
jgi:hypothetical protein